MKLVAQVGKRSYKMKMEPAGDGTYRVELDGDTFLVDAKRVGTSAIISLLIEGRSYETHIAGKKGDYHVALVGSAFDVDLQDELAARITSKRAEDASGLLQSISAPMPGLVVDLKVSVGDRVEAGEAVAVVEAMKMQNELSALAAGVVSEVHVKQGDAVASGQALVTLKTE